ncbi:hypothetical protein Hanom_Chr17g01570911 [Helianthus anomalus]
MLNRGGYTDTPMCYLGGFHFMVVMKNKDMETQFLYRKDELWGEHFVSVILWEGQCIKFEWVAELKINGVPFHIQDYEIFDNIGVSFGRIVKGSDFSWAESYVPIGGAMF